MLIQSIPLAILTDSYKATHFLQYPEAAKMVAYGEFRKGYDGDRSDSRLVFSGMRYIIETYVARRWTREDVDKAALFFSTHNAGFTPMPFPRDLFLKFIEENDGYFPVRIEALPEGTVCYPHTPVYQITTEGEYARLVTFLETLLTMVWYPTTVGTLSRRARDIIEESYRKSVDDEDLWTLESRLHDFGFRGCTSVEQSVLGGCAHLINFEGSDTMSAAYYAQFHLNGGRPVATSIPATEHSVMTSYRTEADAIRRMIDQFGTGVFACVMDSYDYTEALEKVLPSIGKEKVNKGGFMVLRPDSGDPVEVVLQGLRAADKVFGHRVNKKGFKVINGAGVIQGDGINYNTMKNIADAVLAEGYAAQCVAYGMGAGLLQKLNRDTLSFATKLSFVQNLDGSYRNIMKNPKTDASKMSLPGRFIVQFDEKGLVTVLPKDANDNGDSGLLRVVYDKGPVPVAWDDFETVRARVKREWAKAPPNHNPVSAALRQLQESIRREQHGI